MTEKERQFAQRVRHYSSEVLMHELVEILEEAHDRGYKKGFEEAQRIYKPGVN